MFNDIAKTVGAALVAGAAYTAQTDEVTQADIQSADASTNARVEVMENESIDLASATIARPHNGPDRSARMW